MILHLFRVLVLKIVILHLAMFTRIKGFQNMITTTVFKFHKNAFIKFHKGDKK